MRRIVLLILAMVGGSAALAWATSYPSVTFGELVKRSDVIFVGEVVDVRPFSIDTVDGRMIETRVVFQVTTPLWGTSSQREVFDFLGGELNGIGMAIADMPRFAVGDRRVVFARRERSINPIVGFTQGLFQVQPDSDGVERVLTLDGAPVSTPESIGRVQREAVRVTPMRLSDFRDRISVVLRETGRR